MFIFEFVLQTTTEITSYFEPFGELESIRTHSKYPLKYGFLQFKTEEIALNVLSTSPHRISNCNVKVKVADLLHQPDLNMVPAQDSQLNILNALHDDCFQEIFKYFDLHDLTNVAGVCVYFNQMAKENFSSNYKHITLTCDSGNFEKNLLRHFGSSIESLTVVARNRESNNATLQLMSECCSTAKLKTLRLVDFSSGTEWTKLQSIFARLEELTLECCSFNDGMKKMLANCGELKQLNCTNCTMYGKYINKKFPKIQNATFHSNTYFCCSEFITFITQNRSLKCLSITSDIMIYLNMSKVIQTVVRRRPNLLELEISQNVYDLEKFDRNITSLSRLKRLKVLKLNFNSISVASLMKGLVENRAPIEHLKCSNGKVDADAIKAISQMKQIRILQFIECYCLSDDYINDLAKSLPQLQEIHLENLHSLHSIYGLKNVVQNAPKLSLLELTSIDGISIDMYDYKMLLKAVQNRTEKVKLVIQVKCDADKIDIPKEMLGENCDHLEIIQKV